MTHAICSIAGHLIGEPRLSISKAEALASARKLVRTFGSAPDPRRHARTLLGLLTKAHGWSAGQVEQMQALDAWLDSHPPIGELRPRCDQALAKLS